MVDPSKFRIRKAVDDDGVELEEETTKNGNPIFTCARDGDHLVTSFQCTLCHYRNIHGEEPDKESPTYKEFDEHVTRVNLDAFWNRAEGTVDNTRRELLRIQETAIKLGLRHTTPPMGPFPLRDCTGMVASLLILDRSNDKGRTEKHVQPTTFRKTQAALTNHTEASLEGLGDRVGAHERKKTWISSSDTHKRFFTQFMGGIKKRVGEAVKQDEPITIDVLHAALGILEERYAVAKTPEEKVKISRLGAWKAAGFCTALRGEEHLIIETAGTEKSFVHLDPNKHKIPYFCFTVSGRTKDNQGNRKKFQIPCAAETKGTKLKPGMWGQRYVNDRKTAGYKGGFLFSDKKDGRKCKLSDFEDDFLEVIEEVQNKHPKLIPEDVDVREDYGIWRSVRRGATSHATNMKIPDGTINMMQRWSKERASRGSSSKPLLHVYTKLDSIIPTLLRYSLSF